MVPELFDIGAQAERTALSWQRTGIGVIAIGALLLRWCVTESYPLWPGIALAASGSGISLFIVRHRYRRVLAPLRRARRRSRAIWCLEQHCSRC